MRSELCGIALMFILVPCASAVANATEEGKLEAVARTFTKVSPYQPAEIESLSQALPHGDPGSVFLPGANLSPPTRALLKVQASEGTISPVRYRLRYGLVQVPNPPKADPLTVSFVRIDRFNLGPARLDALKRKHGADHVRAESFADEPHASWRFAMRPVMGTTAMTVAASRTDIPHAFAEAMDCLGVPCTAETAVQPPADLDWQVDDAPDAQIEAEYAIERDGVPSPAALLDLLLAASGAARRNGGIIWHGFEPREGVAPGTPFVDIVIETGLGQEGHITGVLRDDHLMDHEIRTQWVRLHAVATSPGQAPVMELARAQVPWPRPQFD
jgi:hypothetical protein